MISDATSDSHWENGNSFTFDMETSISALKFVRPDSFSPGEWEARVQLAAAYRIFHLLGWTELIYNHISLRIQGPETHFLINPFGLHYSEVTASNLLRIDLQGHIVGTSDWPFNPAGFTPHAAIHSGIPNAHCVMHTHTTAGMAVACLNEDLSMSNFYAAQLYGKVAYHEFEGITLCADEAARLLKSIDGKPAVILRNHGLLAWGDTPATAFAALWLLQRACEVQVATKSMGEPRIIPEGIQRQCTVDSLQFDPRFGAGRDVFEALTRQIDRIDPSYRA